METNEGGATPSSPSRFLDQSSAPHGVVSAEAGHGALDEIEDADIQSHGKLLNDMLLRAYDSSQAHLIAIKKRLIEEKEIALAEAERNYLNQYDRFQREIRELKDSLQEQERQMERGMNGFDILSEKSATLIAKHSAKYSSPTSISRAFTAWAELARNSRRADKLDLIAKTFARKFLLAQTFLTMRLNSHRRRSAKASAEAKFKFDSVTSEMVKSYETQIQALREDLKEAYMTIEAEQVRRQQLEEDLRRMFLKNMTAMNFEALTLFQNSHNMVESVHTKPIRSTVPSATPPRPVRRDLVTPSSLQKAGHHHHHHHRGPLSHELTEEEAQYQAQLDAMMHAAPLPSPALSAPPAHAPHYPALRSVGSVNSMNGEPRSPAGYAHQLSEAYHGAVSSTVHLARNVSPPGTGNARSHSPHTSPTATNTTTTVSPSQGHITPLSGSFSRRSPPGTATPAATSSTPGPRGNGTTTTPASSAQKRPFR